jgi:dTDP-4-amino-4,6-dideoxygalactose transaminase
MTQPLESYRIPFNRTSLVGDEMAYILESLRGGQVAGNQTFSRRCAALLEETLGAPRALLTTSCTHALELSALLLDLGPGDEVIVPTFTFVSTVNAFVLRGARPIFADVRPDTLNLDEARLEALVTPRTRAIVPVHYAGVGCELDELLAVAARHGVTVVEDNAHGLFGKYRGRWLGTFGRLATQSFHETKNFTCGEGGALVVNDPALVERAEILSEKGTDRRKFFRGLVDKYTWIDVGSSYVMSDVLAAFLYGQLEQRDRIQARRRAIWERYHAALAGWCLAHGVRQPVVPAHCEQAYHMYYVVCPTPALRSALIAHLGRLGILSVFHYQPLHTSPMGQRYGGRAGDCPVAEWTSERLLRLPMFFDLRDDAQEEVIAGLRAFEG